MHGFAKGEPLIVLIVEVSSSDRLFRLSSPRVSYSVTTWDRRDTFFGVHDFVRDMWWAGPSIKMILSTGWTNTMFFTWLAIIIFFPQSDEHFEWIRLEKNHHSEILKYYVFWAGPSTIHPLDDKAMGNNPPYLVHESIIDTKPPNATSSPVSHLWTLIPSLMVVIIYDRLCNV